MGIQHFVILKVYTTQLSSLQSTLLINFDETIAYPALSPFKVLITVI